MSLFAKRESLARIHGRYQRAGRPHKQRILDEFCATCGYHRKSALRLLHRPLALPSARRRPGPKLTYDPVQLLPVLKVIWLRSDQLCSKLLKAALAECHRQAGAGYVVGAGCEVPRGTPRENVLAMTHYARTHR